MPEEAAPTLPKARRLDAFEAVFQVAQMSTRRSVKGWRIFVALLVVVLPIGLSLLVRRGAPARHQVEFFYAMLSVFHFGIAVPVVAMLLATAFPWPEAAEGTLTYWFTLPVRRWQVLLGRYLSSIVVGTLLLPVCVLAIGLPLTAPEDAELPSVMRSAITATLLVYPAYVALFQLVATAFRLGLILGVVYILVENVVSMLSGTIVQLTLIYYVRSQLQPAVPPAWRSTAYEVLKAVDPAGNATAIVVFAATTVTALTLSLLLVEVIEYRGRTTQPG